MWFPNEDTPKFLQIQTTPQPLPTPTVCVDISNALPLFQEKYGKNGVMVLIISNSHVLNKYYECSKYIQTHLHVCACLCIYSSFYSGAALSLWHTYTDLTLTTITNLNIFQYILKAWTLAWQVTSCDISRWSHERKECVFTLCNSSTEHALLVNHRGSFFIHFSKDSEKLALSAWQY